MRLLYNKALTEVPDATLRWILLEKAATMCGASIKDWRQKTAGERVAIDGHARG